MAEKNPGAYIVTHEKTGLFYVGSSGDTTKRSYEHKTMLNAGDHHAKRFQEAYAEDPAIKVDVFPAKNRDEAYDVEQSLLDKYRDNPNLTNIATSARLGDVNKSRAGQPLSESTRSKMSEVRKGRPHSEQHSQAISNSLKGKPKTVEHVAKVQASRVGFKHDEETKARIAAKVKETKAAKKAALQTQS